MGNSEREIIVIPNETKIASSYYRKELRTDEPHGSGIKRFSDIHNLGLSIESLGLRENDYNDMKWYTETAKLGHLVIQKDEDIIFYIPPVLTKQQYRFLIENKTQIKNFNHRIHAFSIFEENGTFYHDGLDELLQEYENDQVEVLYKALREKYIPVNNSSVIIIPNEEELSIEDGIYEKEFDSNLLNGHGDIYREFCKEYNLLEANSSFGFEWGQKLAYLGIMSITNEDNEIYLYIPKKLSSTQYEWLVSNKDKLINSSLLEAVIYLEYDKKEYVYSEHLNPTEEEKIKLVERIFDYIEENKKRR